jgi:hypothetical protein
MPAAKDVGEPCAGEPHARFDGRELETERGHGHRTWAPGGNAGAVRRGLPPFNATAPAPYPTATPMAGFQTLLGLGTGREPSTYLEILGPQPATGTPRRPGRKTGITRVVPPSAG